jgi:non-homologous end joining protein Ku
MDNKTYHHNYYVNHYKNIVAEKKIFCECCNVEVSAWNIWKHKNSKKHKYNLLSDEEKLNYDNEIKTAKIQKFINKLEGKKLIT